MGSKGRVKWREDYLKVVDFKSGNQEAGKDLYNEVEPLLVNYLHKKLDLYFLSKEDFEDLKSNVICKTLIDIEKYNGECKFSTWIIGYAKNFVFLKISELVREKKKFGRLVLEYDDYYHDPLDLLIDLETKEYIHQQLLLLKPEMYLIIYCHFFQDMKLSEISDVLEISISTVSNKYHNTLIYLKNVLLCDFENLF